MVKGSTFIDHKIRTKLGLSLIEYVIIDALDQCVINNEPYRKGVRLQDMTGFDSRESGKVIAELVSRGHVVNASVGFLPGPYWRKEFPHDENFQKLWDLFMHTGSRGKAMVAYYKAIKVAPLSAIIKGAESYITAKKKTTPPFNSIMHLSSFLSPEFRYWEDEHKPVIKKNDTDEENTFKGSIG